MSQGLTLSIPRLPLVWGLHAHRGHQVVNLFHLVVVLASVKQIRKRVSDTVIRYFTEEPKQRTWGEGSFPGRPRRSCLVTTASQCLCSGKPYFTYQWPQSARVEMLAIRICQREAIKFFL